MDNMIHIFGNLTIFNHKNGYSLTTQKPNLVTEKMLKYIFHLILT